MKKSFFVLGLVLALLGCASQQKTTQRNAGLNIPEWVLNPPVDNDGVVYGIGYSRSFVGDYDDAYDEVNARVAEEKAYVSAAYESYFAGGELSTILAIMDNVQIEGAEDFEWVLNDGTRTVKLTWDVSCMETVKLEKSSDGTWWCLAAYNRGKWWEDIQKRMEDAFRRLDGR